MMTVHKLSAGDGYTYYLRETASADVRRPADQELGDYYLESGNPPGVWMGSGIEALGVSGTVTEPQMKALFGEGVHPERDRIVAERIAAGDSVKKAMRAAKLGRSYYRYHQADTAFGRKLAEDLQTFERLNHREPDAADRAELRGKAGAVTFRKEHGRGPSSTEELGQWISGQEHSKANQAVAGYDLVFKPEPGITALWSLGAPEVQHAIEAEHQAAIGDTLQWLEKNAIMTRTGVNGIAQENVASGLVATRWRHYENRNGDAMLHDHVVVSNKVQGVDGKWRSIDGTLLHKMVVAASEHYNARVLERTCERLGLRAEAREVTPGKRPVMSIAGVPEELIQLQSTRGTDIKRRTEELVAEYRQTHGREPSTKKMYAIAKQAAQDGRPDKKKAEPLAVLRKRWRKQAVAELGTDRIDTLLQTAKRAAQQIRPGRAAAANIDVNAAAQQVLTTVSDERSVWGRRQVLAEAQRWVTQTLKGADPGRNLVERITHRVLTEGSVKITPPDPNPQFAPLQRADGTSIYRHRETEIYTSNEVLAAEDRMVAAARTDVIPAVTPDIYNRVEAAYQQAHPDRPLDAGQRAMARSFATSDRLVSVAIGPAGAGKTTSMRVAADAVREGGNRVIGLGPSARAAAELSDGINAPAYTLHEWLGARERLRVGGRVGPEFRLNQGDVVVVDEAGMAGTRRLARVVEEAAAAGALVRLVGDPYQLASVESGGALRLLTTEVGAVELEAVHRFSNPEEAAASLTLRSGEPDQAWDWYLANNRIVAGSHDEMLHHIFADWQQDQSQGHTAMMMADDNDTVAQLNARAQAWRAGTGEIDMRRGVALRDGLEAHRGDLVVTRRNARKNTLRGGRDFVKNGDQWEVEKVRRNGDLVVRHTRHRGRTMLPADYVARYTELGYASTGHRGQGATVDTGSGLFSRSTTRESAYVQTTRGRLTNRIYVVLEKGEKMRDVLASVARNTQASLSARETIRTEQDRAWNIGKLVAEYHDVHDRAAGLRYQNLTRNVLGPAAEHLIAEDAWPAVTRALRDVERAGFAPEKLLNRAYHQRDFGDAEDSAAVLSWRLDNHLTEAREAQDRLEKHQPTRPLADLTDTQLQSLADRAGARRRTALDALRRTSARLAGQPKHVVVDGLPHPAWPSRTYGDLTRRQLSDAIAQARRDGRIATIEGARDAAREAAEDLRTLRKEQQLRASMSRLDRVREEWQREPGTGHAHTSRQPVEATLDEMRTAPHDQDQAAVQLARADLIHQRIRAEQRLRTILPGAAKTVPDSSSEAVPQWLAPRDVERDAHTPTAWRSHLSERRQILADRLGQTGRELAADPPAWTRPLGPVPAQGTELRETWERTAALADAWRARHQTRSTEPGIGSRPSSQQDAAEWDKLHEQVATTGRRARATEAAAARGSALADRPEPAQETDQSSGVEGRHEARRRTMADLRARLDRGREDRAAILDRTEDGRSARPQTGGQGDEGRTAAARRERDERDHQQRDDRDRGGPER
ncbi:MobF family relaxase [Streptomyces sp. NPDC014733]|uniref:MobF family relaxase n=1 Tax=Streptomyces sp. NPDC014733 TaxID=3364885 RepID=UPI0036F59E24